MTLSVVAAIEYSGAAERPRMLTPDGLEHVDEVGADLHRHAVAQTRAELDFAALLVAEHVLDQERHAAERAVAEVFSSRPSMRSG